MHDKLASENTEQEGPLNLLHKSSLKFLSLWLWHYRETERNERHGQKKMSIMVSDYRGSKSLASCAGISVQRIMQFHSWKKNSTHTRWAFSHFIYKCYCLPQCHSYILHTETCLCVRSSYQWKLQTSAIQADGFKYIFWKNSNNNYFSLLQTKRHIDMIGIPWSTNVLIPQDSAGK